MLKLAKMLSNIMEMNDLDDIENQEIVRNLIDHQFEATQSFYSKQFILYIFAHCIPLMLQVFFLKSTFGVIMCNVSSLVTMWLVIFVLELVEIKNNPEYLYKSWNWIDLLQIIFMTILAITRIVHPAVPLPKEAYAEGKSFEKNITNNMSKETYYFIPFLNCIVLTFTFFKLLFYLRVYKSFGQLVLMLKMSINATRTFLLFMAIWILFFTVVYRIFGVTFDEGGFTAGDDYDDDHGDYRLVFPQVVYLLSAIRNSIGDLAPPHVFFWAARYADGDEMISRAAIYFTWILWFTQILVMLIIILNFLIAIVSQAYEEVITKES